MFKAISNLCAAATSHKKSKKFYSLIFHKTWKNNFFPKQLFESILTFMLLQLYANNKKMFKKLISHKIWRISFWSNFDFFFCLRTWKKIFSKKCNLNWIYVAATSCKTIEKFHLSIFHIIWKNLFLTHPSKLDDTLTLCKKSLLHHFLFNYDDTFSKPILKSCFKNILPRLI